MFRKRLPDEATPAIAPQVAQVVAASEPDRSTEGNSAKEILELLELELGGMIRQLERAAHSVAGGAEATAATLSAIRERTDALAGRTSEAQSTATTFSLAADKFTHSAEGIGAQVRDAGRLADQANAAAHETGLPPNVEPWWPACQVMSSARAIAAEMGMPEAMPFAVHRMSGSTPQCSIAHIFPHRPKPASTSSMQRYQP
jgi:hypothetical protein